jgi:lipoprotein-anchoring transpeptidase ErfK/SrfK
MPFRKKPTRHVYVNYGASNHRRISKRRRSVNIKPLIVLLLLLMALAFSGYVYAQYTHKAPSGPKDLATTGKTDTKANSQKQSASKTKPPAPATNYCATNKLSQLVLVSISKRRLWACNGTTIAYDSAVVTGMENLPADLTPTGTYHIYSKQRNLYLNGSDGTGSWHDYVYYWMPWLSNKYGVYGFHDATWRKPNAFGNISPYSSNASHGCVELPIATAKWLYNWAQIGTTVTIES